MIQADLRQFLLTAPLNLEIEDLNEMVLESPLGDRRRIDIEIGATVIEVKKDLKKGKVRSDAIEQLYGYVEKRIRANCTAVRRLLTDGAIWECYHTRGGKLELRNFDHDRAPRAKLDIFLVWLEGVLATTTSVIPTSSEIEVVSAH